MPVRKSAVELAASRGARVQAHRWPKATAEQSDIEGGSYAPEKREGRSSAACHVWQPCQIESGRVVPAIE
jgi:hypothetical protein